MDPQQLLEYLAADFTRLRSVAAGDLTAPVPNCPEWTVDDLVRHVAEVYLHKTECIRTGRFPEPWPPGPTNEPTLDLLDRAYQELTGEFTSRGPSAPALTWFEPDQTVGFWIRRLALETVVHRVDAEQAAGLPITPISPDLAVDGVDEVLERFLGYGSVAWAKQFTSLPPTELAPVLVAAGDCAWLVRATPTGVRVRPGRPGDELRARAVPAERTAAGEPAPGGAGATVAGGPAAMLLWLWRRAPGGVQIDGDPTLIDRLQSMLRDATQ